MNLVAKIFFTSYSHTDGVGTWRYKYSRIIDISMALNPIKVSKYMSVIHGVATNTVNPGQNVNCVLGPTANTEFLLGG
ncbi:hypothetical protein ACE38V_11510 [Cytobacillus sp. Hz8]|uniref:hypothetical protein n=1 Tax=Cytobacillus sp. Hz8 TaxID=3347168 RepID=UPI0035D6BC9B